MKATVGKYSHKTFNISRTSFMKKNLLVLALAATSAGFAMAADGTITVYGEVVTQTCAVAAGDSNKVVYMPVALQSALNANAAVTGGTPFSIALTGCTAGNSMSAHFLPGATISNATGNLINQAAAPTAGNVEVALFDTTGATRILMNNAKGAQVSPAFVVPVGGAVSMAYQAKYYATAAATPGKVQSTVDYNLSYF